MTIIEEHKALKVGSLLVSNHGDYEIESILGMGSFGITYKATKIVYDGNIAHKHTYAIKEFFCSDMCMRNEDGNVVVNSAQQENYNTLHKAFQEEARLLHKLPNHNGFVSVNELFDANNTSYYVMQYLDNSLTQKVQESSEHKLSEEEALDIFCTIAEAVAILHDNRRLHLDIKPDNIMFSGDTPCLIDFGNSRAYNKKGKMVSQDTEIVCSDGYAPQEQYSGVETFSPPTDIYSLGATLLYMLTGEDPISANVISDAYINEKMQNVKDARIKKVIHTSLSASPNSRYESVNQLLASLKYVTTGGTETKIISEKKTTKRGTDFSTFAKIGKYALYCIAVILVACLVILGGSKMLSSCNNSIPTGDIIPDTSYIHSDTTIVISDKPNIKENTISSKKTEEKKPIEESYDNDKPKANATSGGISNSLNLGWGIWYGTIKNGEPKGTGWIEVHKEKTIHGVTVLPGDKIKECELDGKSVYIGTVCHRDGTIEDILP